MITAHQDAHLGSIHFNHLKMQVSETARHHWPSYQWKEDGSHLGPAPRSAIFKEHQISIVRLVEILWGCDYRTDRWTNLVSEWLGWTLFFFLIWAIGRGQIPIMGQTKLRIVKAEEEGLDVIHRRFPAVINMSNSRRSCQFLDLKRIRKTNRPVSMASQGPLVISQDSCTLSCPRCWRLWAK